VQQLHLQPKMKVLQGVLQPQSHLMPQRRVHLPPTLVEKLPPPSPARPLPPLHPRKPTTPPPPSLREILQPLERLLSLHLGPPLGEATPARLEEATHLQEDLLEEAIPLNLATPMAILALDTLEDTLKVATTRQLREATTHTSTTKDTLEEDMEDIVLPPVHLETILLVDLLLETILLEAILLETTLQEGHPPTIHRVVLQAAILQEDLAPRVTTHLEDLEVHLEAILEVGLQATTLLELLKETILQLEVLETAKEEEEVLQPIILQEVFQQPTNKEEEEALKLHSNLCLWL